VTCLTVTLSSVIHISEDILGWKQLKIWFFSKCHPKPKYSAHPPGTFVEHSYEAMWVDRKKWVWHWTRVKVTYWGK
jgi:hypothetical protein